MIIADIELNFNSCKKPQNNFEYLPKFNKIVLAITLMIVLITRWLEKLELPTFIIL